jgi:hypothetical protein
LSTETPKREGRLRAHTLWSAFDQFVDRISVARIGADVLRSRPRGVIDFLQNSGFTIVNHFPSGSLSRGTAIRRHSDLDLMVVLHRRRHVDGKSPSELLHDAHAALAGYRQATAQVRENGQAVTISYGSWPNVDLVPVYAAQDAHGLLYYNVPDAKLRLWRVSRPHTHARRVQRRIRADGPRFLEVIKLLKWWNKQNGELMHPYRIEVIALEAPMPFPRDYADGLLMWFDTAIAVLDGRLQTAEAVPHQPRADLKDLLTAARATCRDTQEHFRAGSNHQLAIEAWARFFGPSFPVPY